LTAEVILLFPLASAFIILMNIKNMGVIGKVSFPIFLFLLCTGIVTSLPLLCFNYGVKKIELKTVGFLQYLSPTFQLFLGVVAFKEAFTLNHMISFALIWAALIIYSLPYTSFMRKHN